MKKSTASLTLAAVAGLTVLSASPAVAAPFQNCDQAALAGVYNIPANSPAYNLNSDRDKDGVACENSDVAYRADLVPADPVVPVTPVEPATDVTPVNPVTGVGPAPVTPVAPTAPVAPVAPQVAQMPVGGAATGIAQDTTDNTAALALGAGLVLVAAAGGTFVVRRRTVKA